MYICFFIVFSVFSYSGPINRIVKVVSAVVEPDNLDTALNEPLIVDLTRNDTSIRVVNMQGQEVRKLNQKVKEIRGMRFSAEQKNINLVLENKRLTQVINDSPAREQELNALKKVTAQRNF